VGNLACWRRGHAVCTFWGPMPASAGSEPRATSRVTVFGHMAATAADLFPTQSGEAVKLERVP
jgi:hypothetical protein